MTVIIGYSSKGKEGKFMFKDDEFIEPTGDNLINQNITGRNESDPMANTPVRVLTAKSIIGDKVENSKGDNLGEIKDIMLNVNTGCTEYVVLQFGGFLGFGEKLFAVPFRAMNLNPDKEIFVLDIEKDFLDKAPGFDKDHWPKTNSRHWNEVNSYWTSYSGPNYPRV